VAVSYGARADIACAARSLAEAVAAGRLRPEDVTPAALEARLSSAGALAAAGPVDLCIRTSGTQRLSNFLLWEMAYSELYFDPDLWPAFGEANFERALRAYAASERRFGGRGGGGGGGAAAR
jgi:undecaprenyl diphosphate synthase